jgi:predicted CopG family antitoxin
MKKKIELDEETARMLDEVRGDLSRSEYVDRLLKKHQGVTLLIRQTPNEP